MKPILFGSIFGGKPTQAGTNLTQQFTREEDSAAIDALFLENEIGRIVHENADDTGGDEIVALETSDMTTSAGVVLSETGEFLLQETYILEFGNLYIRFYKDNGQITEATKSISAITKANPAVVTATSHGYSDGDHVWINDVVGMTEVNARMEDKSFEIFTVN